MFFIGGLFQFYEAACIGMNVVDNMAVTFSLEHAFSVMLCIPNSGLTNLGVEVGHKFWNLFILT